MPERENQTDIARTILDLAVQRWGPERPLAIVGRSPALVEVLNKVVKFAQADSPVLITGETGTGKDLFARSLSLLSCRRQQPFLSVNCAQYQDGHLLASELFGHKKGTFTGAIADRVGVFEEAGHGVVFLDEIAELPLSAQAMVLRTLSEGEVVRVGESRPRPVHMRVVAATARPLEQMIDTGAFREDLFFRLRFLRLRIPPLRERGDDCGLIASHVLACLNAVKGSSRRLSGRSYDVLASHIWPGNVRELKSIMEVAFFNSSDVCIEPESFAGELAQCRADAASPRAASSYVSPSSGPVSGGDGVAERYRSMMEGQSNFWDVVYRPFLERELNRAQVRAIVSAGLSQTRGSYKRLVPLLGIDPQAYLRFMDFLRHHRLKPTEPQSEAGA